MNDKRNNFVCIGAVHRDYILKLQKNYLKNRTNPVNQSIGLGGVAYNVAEKLAFLNLKTELISLNCLKEEKKIINKKKINLFPLNKKIYDRSYTSIINNKEFEFNLLAPRSQKSTDEWKIEVHTDSQKIKSTSSVLIKINNI